jgi:predicted RecB family nuclease
LDESTLGIVTSARRDAYRGFWQTEQANAQHRTDCLLIMAADSDPARTYHYAPYEPSAFKRLSRR